MVSSVGDSDTPFVEGEVPILRNLPQQWEQYLYLLIVSFPYSSGEFLV